MLIEMLTTYQTAEKALMSLPSPLTASDEWMRARETTLDVVRLTAGLHRQVWVSGTSIYVDVHIENNSRKVIKKIELQLERDILCYKHVCLAMMMALSYFSLMHFACRLLHQLWKDLQARRGYSTTMNAQYSARLPSSKVLPAGTVYLLTKHTPALATWKYLVDTLQSNAVCSHSSSRSRAEH